MTESSVVAESSISRNSRRRAAQGSALLFAVALPGLAEAYVGPGAGLSLLTALWGLVAAVAIAVGFVVMWPIRRLLRRRRNAAHAAAEPAPSPAAESAPTAAKARDELETLAGQVPVAARRPVGTSERAPVRH